MTDATHEKEYPGWEYSRIGVFFGSILSVFRISMGDFPIIDQTREMDDVENVIFWLVFFTILVTTNIIMLNFLIAFVTQAYEEVITKQSQSQYQHKSEMNLQLAQYIDYFEKRIKANDTWWIKLWIVQKYINW